MSSEIVRRGHVWNNLPLHFKGLALLMVPVPALMLTVVCLSSALREERQALQSIDQIMAARQKLQDITSVLSVPASPESDRLLEKQLGRARQARSKLLAQAEKGGFIFLLGELLAALVFLGAITGQVNALKTNSRRLAEGVPLLPLFTDNWELNQIGRDLVTASVALNRSERELSQLPAVARHPEATQEDGSRQAADSLAADLRQRNQELAAALTSARESLSAKARFLSELSREVRIPLSSILGFSELLYDGKLGPVNEQQKGCISDILAGSKRILQLADGIVGAARAGSVSSQNSPAAFDLEQLMKEVNYSLVPAARRRGVRVDIELDPNLREIKADRARLYQLLERHMGNAVQCTPHDETLAVHVLSEGGDCLRMEFNHTGIGLAPADLVHLYPDFRVTAATEDSGSPALMTNQQRMGAFAAGQMFYVILPGVAQPVEAKLPVRAPAAQISPGGVSRLLN